MLVFTDLPRARATMTELFGQLSTPDESGVDIHEELVPGPDGAPPDVRLRIYTPHRRLTTAALYDVHGGGFILGDVDVDHAANLRFARELGVVVVSVDYRLAPKHPFPAGLEDTYAGLGLDGEERRHARHRFQRYWAVIARCHVGEA